MRTTFSRRKALAYSTLILAVLILTGFWFSTNEASASNENKPSGMVVRTESHGDGFENYDIRNDKSDAIAALRLKFRTGSNQSAASIADVKSDFVAGESRLREQVPTLKIEYSTDLRSPEVIAADVKKGNAFLTGPTNAGRIETLRSFVSQHSLLVGISPRQAGQLKVLTDYTNPNGILSFTHLEQEINGIPVFRGEIKAGFTKDGRIIRVINSLAPGLDYSNLATKFGDPLDAVGSAASNINYKLQNPDVTKNPLASTNTKTVFGDGDWATTAEKMYFPIEPGVARSAWRVLIWQPVNAYYIIVDDETGSVLWRKNITEDQTQSATYEVYRNANAFMDVADSPAPLTPGPIDPSLGTQGAILTRENVTLIGNEGSLSFNNNGWITDGANGTDGHTDGNATEAGLDLTGGDGVDAPFAGTGRVFSSAWNPPPGNPAPGDVPSDQAARDGAVIQMFYVVNRYHDALYQLGFTEAAFNFQQDNFGRGGSAGDRIRSEGQDSSGTSNANFSTPSDGGRGRMQMYVFTGPSPDRDGTTDADVIIHELTHGTSNRLHFDSSGLTGDMSRGMGEGWGDFYAHALLSEPSDPINGVYTTGGYLLNTASNSANFYYGIRSLPKAVMAFTGGPNNRPHNSLTFADIDSTQANNSDAAFAPRFGPQFGSPHFRGEVWSSALWEVRALMINRLGFAAGNRKVLEVVTDGMKLAPPRPTFLQERDAIIAAAFASSLAPESSTDVQDVWEGFRIRGMGFSASVESTSPVRVTEAFDEPNVFVAEPGFAVTDAPGDNDGFPEPGEPLTLTVPISNTSGQTINSVTVNINGGSNISYGNIADGSTVTNQIAYTIPAANPCGGVLGISINISSSVGPRTETRELFIGQPNSPQLENFDGVTAPALPTNWTAAQTGPGVAFVSQSGSTESAPNSVFTPNMGQPGGNSGATIDSDDYVISPQGGVLKFRNKYNTEFGWDGGVLEININGAGFQDIVDAGGNFSEGGYNGTLGPNSNPLDDRAAWTGDSGGYITSSAVLPPAANGQPVKFRWRFGEDTNTSSIGWNVDDVEVFTGFTCSFASQGSARFDFDGDSKTDVSIFRPGPAEWWIMRSSDGGNNAFQFGQPTDTPVPADYTGDGKTDVAFWRESSGEWFILRSEDSTFFSFPFGTGGDIPAPGDYDGDGKADNAVFRPANGTWFILNSGGGTTIQGFGIAEDRPVVEDYDGDGKDDIAIFRPSVAQWWLNRSQDGVIVYQFGATTDRAVPADYTGDGKADVGFWRPASGEWFILRSEDTSFFAFPFGTNGDTPVPGDYDGDGKADPSVFRPSDNTWYLLQSTSGFGAIPFGINNDVPLPSVYIP